MSLGAQYKTGLLAEPLAQYSSFAQWATVLLWVQRVELRALNVQFVWINDINSHRRAIKMYICWEDSHPKALGLCLKLNIVIRLDRSHSGLIKCLRRLNVGKWTYKYSHFGGAMLFFLIMVNVKYRSLDSWICVVSRLKSLRKFLFSYVIPMPRCFEVLISKLLSLLLFAEFMYMLCISA